MSNGNGFVPPEAKKKQAASQQGFVPPEVKKKDRSGVSPSPSVSGDSSSGLQEPEKRLEVNEEGKIIPYAKAYLSPEEAKTAPLDTVERSLKNYQQFYGADLYAPGSNRYAQYQNMVSTYRDRVRKEGEPNKKAALFQQEAFTEILKEDLNKNIITEDDFISYQADPEAYYEDMANMNPDIFRMKIIDPVAFKFEKEKLQREKVLDITERVKQKFIDTIPEEERTPERLRALEEELWQEGDIRLDLTGDKIIGEKKSMLSEVPLGFLKGGTSQMLALLSAGADLIGAEETARYLDEERKKEVERLSKYMTQVEGDILDNLAQGNINNAARLSLQMTGESLPLMLGTRGLVGGISKPILRNAVSYGTFSGVSAIDHYQDVKNEKWFNDMSDIGKLGYLAAYGGAEGIGEMVGSRVAGKAFKGLSTGDKIAKQSVSDFFKEYGKALGVAFSEEGLAEGVTGVSQYIADTVAQGGSINIRDAWDAFSRSAVAGMGMAGVTTTAGKGLKGSILALNSIPVKKADKELKDILNAAQQTDNIKEKDILAARAKELSEIKSQLTKQEGERLNRFSEEDLSTYVEKTRELNEVSSDLKEVEEGSEAEKILKEKAQRILGEISELNDKYKEDAVQERKTEEVPVGEQAQVGEEMVGEVREQTEEVRGEEEVTAPTKEVDKVAKVAGVKAKNIRGLYDINRKMFGQNRVKSLASAVVMDRAIGQMAKRSGVSKAEMYGKIQFKKGEKAPSGALKQEALIFKSTAQEGIGKIQQKAATPEQWVKMINDKGGKGTSQELEWIGLEDFLNDYKRENNVKSVPKEVVEQYINDNQIEIVEVSKSDTNFELLKANRASKEEALSKAKVELKNGIKNFQDGKISLEEYNRLLLNEEIARKDFYEANSKLEAARKTPEKTKYSQYTLEGGENYREVLLTMPVKNVFDRNQLKITKNRQSQTQGTYSVSYKGETILDGYDLFLGNRELSESEIKAIAESVYREGDKFNNKENMDGAYRSSHWDESNILAHLRINERTLPNGERVMFIEEVQSDWAQEGKKKGFKSKNKQPKLDGETVSVNGEKVGVIRKTTFEMWLGKRLIELTIDELETLRNNPDRMKIYRDEYANNPTYTVENSETGERATYSSKEKALKSFEKDYFKTPDMPYKKTDQWVGMAMRRALKMAADEGFDRVAWVTGEQSAERYDLSKQVDRIEVGDMADGNRSAYVALKDNTDVQLFIDPKTGVVLQSSNKALEGNNLSDVVGKEMSEKILTFDTDKGRVIDGEGLKVGGEGMKAFYNSILPKVAKKEAQRFDKNAKVEVVDFRGKTTQQNERQVQELKKQLQSKENLTNEEQRTLDNIIASERAIKTNEASKQLSIAITPEMRMNLNSAVPLFQGEQGAMLAEDGKFIIYALTDPNVSTPLHELAHVYEHYLTEAERNSVLKWAGATEWTTEVSEKFARGFERYLAEGKAPTVSLQKIFDKFKEWLTDIYNGITGSEIDLKLNKPMTDLYNQMLGEAKGKKEVTPQRKAELENKQRAENIARKVVDPDFEQLSTEDQNFYEANQELVDSAIQEMQKTKPVEDTKVQSLAEKIVRGAKDFTDEEVDLYAARSEEVEAAKETIASEMEGQKTPPTPQKLLGIPKAETKTFTIKKLYQLAGVDQRAQRRADVKEQAQVNKKVKRFIKEALQFATRKIPARQVTALLNRAANLSFNRPTSIQKFVDYANKVMEDSEYFAKVESADKTKNKLKKKRKSKDTPANQKQLIFELLGINPRDVDIDKYNIVAEGLLGATTKIQEKEGEVTPTDRMSNAEAKRLIDELRAEAEQTNLRQVAEANEISIEDAQRMIADSKDAMSKAEEEIAKIMDEEMVSEEQAVQIYFDRIQEQKDIRKGVVQDYVEAQVDQLPEGSPLDYLKGIDFSKLTLGQLSQAEMVVDNYLKNGVVYNDFQIQALAEAQGRIGRIIDASYKQRRKKVPTIYRTLGQFVDAILGSQKQAGEFLADIGYVVFQRQRKSVEDAEVRFKKRLEEVIDKYRSDGTRSEESNVRRQVYAIALQLQDYSDRTGVAMDTLFQTFKENLKTSLTSLANEGRDNTTTYKVLEQVIAEMEDANSIDDMQISEGNRAVLDEVIAIHKEIEPELAEFTRRAKNRDMPSFADYLSIQIRGKDSSGYNQEVSAKMSFLDFMLGKSLFPKKSGTLKERGTFKRLESGEYYDLNFNTVQQSSYFNNLFEAKVSMPLSIISKVLDSQNVKDKLSVPFARTVKEYVSAEKDQTFARGQSMFPDSKITAFFMQASYFFKGLSTLYIFGAPLKQLLMQPIVAVNTFFKAFRDFGISGLVSVSNPKAFIQDFKAAKDFIASTTTGSRDVENEILRMNSAQQEKIERFVESKAKNLKKVGQSWQNVKDLKEKVQFLGLRYSDRFASIFTVLSLYRAYLADQGITIESWEKEMELLDSQDPTRERALAYAETNMKGDHNINTRLEVAPIFRSETDPSKRWINFMRTIGENLLAPFSRFVINKKVQIANDAAKLGNKKTAREGAINMLGHATEIVTFNSMAAYVFPEIQKYIGDALFGEDDDEEEERNILKDDIYEDEKKFTKFITGVTTDFLPVVTDYETKLMIDGLNFIYFNTQYIKDPTQFDSLKGEGLMDKFNSWYRLREQPLYKYMPSEKMNQPFSLDIGAYFIAPKVLIEGLNLMTMKDGKYVDAYGNERFLSTKDAMRMKRMGWTMFMGAAGYSFGELSFYAQKKAYDIKKYDSYKGRVDRALKEEDYDIEEAFEENMVEFGDLPGISKSEYELSRGVKDMYDREQEFFNRAASISENEDEFFRVIHRRYKKLPKNKQEEFVDAVTNYVVFNKKFYLPALVEWGGDKPNTLIEGRPMDENEM